MKKLLLLIATAGLILAGCSEPVSVNSTPVSANQPAGKKEFIKIPVTNSLSSELSITFTKKIDGSTGGSISLNKRYFGYNGYVSVSGAVEFPAGAFSGKQTITVNVNTNEASVSFSPHMTFDKPVKLDICYTGANLYGLDPSQVEFIYLSDSGQAENISSDGIYACNGFNTGILSVQGARLSHFSRYGFVKDRENGDGGY